MNSVHADASDVLGWRTTASSKPLAIDELNAAIRDGGVTVLCAKTLAEMRTFVRKENGRMTGSPHDDRIISMAIGTQMLKYVWLPEYRGDVSLPKNSLMWWEQHLFSPQGENRMFIGSHNVRKRTPF